MMLYNNIPSKKFLNFFCVLHLRVSREPSFFAEDGILRLYIRGRPVNLFAPSNVAGFDISDSSSAPKEKLKPEWIYGYRGRDCRSNLHFLPTGEIVYFIASAVVLFNVEQHMQRHYLDHTDDVKWYYCTQVIFNLPH